MKNTATPTTTPGNTEHVNALLTAFGVQLLELLIASGIIAIIEELQPLINQIKKHPKLAARKIGGDNQIKKHPKLAARKIGGDNKNDIPWKYYGPDDTPWKY